MCGIAGIYHLNPGESPSADVLERMTTAISHRGPDDGSIYIDGQVGLGHRRLSIIDVSGGHQPIFNDDRTKAIIYNGEIYNYQPLRRQLEKKGWTFRTQSDTEVILRAYEEYGETCVEHLRGMFALAIWDAPAKRLFLARDRVGIKPLYYFWNGRVLLFGSEIKAILEHPAATRTLDPLAIDEFLSFTYVPAPRSIFKDIRKLRPGYTLSVGPDGLKEREYWDLRFEPDESLSESDWSERLIEVLRESVAVHLMSEVPLGAFLSGGIDSTAVVGLMAGLMDKPVSTASIGFKAAGFDELPYARIAAQRFHTDAYEKIVEADAAKILDTLMWHYDEPFADSSMIPTYYVSGVARERVTVCLSGDGGDENFAGYRRYRFDTFENRVRDVVPAAVRRALFGSIGRVYPKADWLPRYFRAKTLMTNLSLGPEEAYYRSVSFFGRQMKKPLYGSWLRESVGDHDPFSVLKTYFDRAKGWDPLSRIQYVDIKTYLVDDILTKVDRASMAHSLEVRVPILDHQVMEFAARIPARLQLKGGEGKYILKRALRDVLPEEIMNRPKMGFAIPITGWFRRELRSMFEERVFAPDAFLREIMDVDVIRSWWGHHQSGRRDYATQLYTLLVLECWGKRFLAGKSDDTGVRREKPLLHLTPRKVANAVQPRQNLGRPSA
ncbi:MAG: asparagine synthase (glutamine-hydrolyzing) [Candidatus Eiseniibacteriota bacterium]